MTEATVQTANTDVPQMEDPNKNVDMSPMKFRFKKDKLENQRPTIEISAPVPSFDGIVAILQAYRSNPETGKKAYELLRDSMADTVRSAALELISQDEKSELTSDNFPIDKLSWDAIANQDRADRRASSIPAELWAAFAEDYIKTMPALTNKSEQAVTFATVVYLKKFAQIKTDKVSLKKLQDQLAIYVSNTKRGEEFSEILDLLDRKVKAYLAADDIQQLVANL